MLSDNRFQIFLIILFSSLYAVAFNQSIKLSGDEGYYFSLFQEMKRSIPQGNINHYFFEGSIRHGYFVPGTSFILTFFSYLLDSLGLSGISTHQSARFVITIFNSFIFTLICFNAKNITGKFNVLPFLCLFIPYYSFYSGALWGEALATNLAILSIVLFENTIRENKVSKVKLVFNTIIIGGSLSLTALIRPQYSALILVFFLRWLMSTEKKELKLHVLLIPLLGLICIFSWNSSLSDKFGSFFMTISPSQYQFVIDEDYSKEAKESTGVTNRWYSVDRYLKGKAKDYKLDLKETIEIEKQKLNKRTFTEKVQHQAEQLENFYLRESDFLNRFISRGNSTYLNQNFEWLLQTNKYLSYTLFLLSWVLFLTPFKNNIMMSFYYKSMFFFITSQSAFYFSHGRYYISLIILTMVFLIFLSNKRNTVKDSEINIWKINTVKLGYITCWAYALYHAFILSLFFLFSAN